MNAINEEYKACIFHHKSFIYSTWHNTNRSYIFLLWSLFLEIYFIYYSLSQGTSQEPSLMESLEYVLSFPKQNKCKCDRNAKHGGFPLCQCILHPPVIVAKWVTKATSSRHLRVRVQLQVLEQALTFSCDDGLVIFSL